MPSLLTRRGFLAGAAALPLAHGAARFAPAEATPLDAAFLVGNMTVIPILDGPFGLTAALMPQADSFEGDKLVERVGLPAKGPWPQPVNAFVLQRADKVWLVDAGSGTMLGPDLGRVPAALAKLNIDPAKVEAVIMTHLHADHAGGLLTAEGTAFFPNAELVVQQAEVAFWSDDGARSRAPTSMEPMFALARAALKAYPNRVRQVSGTQPAVPGATFVPLPGHTPGHSGVLLADGNDQFLIWADVIHSALLQFPNPSWTVVFDVDQAQAAATRAGILDRLSSDHVPVTGSHIADRGQIEVRGMGYAMVG